MTWTQHNSPHNNGYCLSYINQKSQSLLDNSINNVKLLGFNLENCIIKSKSLGFWVSSPNDWQYGYDMNKLKHYAEKGYLIVIFTNQNFLNNNGFLSVKEYKQLIETIDNDLNIPFQVYSSVAGIYFNKPLNRIWKLFLKLNNIDNDDINREKSRYIGPNAGREKNKYHKKDDNSRDYYFSRNINLQFRTPEQFFLKSKHIRHMMLPISFHPKYYIKKHQEDFKEKLNK